jgi:uncharacterized integral membrane protein (TIGR00698 family)
MADDDPPLAQRLAYVACGGGAVGLVAIARVRDQAPGIALGIGLGIALAVGNPWPKQTAKLSKTLLQICVVLLGFGMDLGTVLDAGRKGFLLALVTIAATLALGAAVGRILGVDRTTSALVSVGTAICGGSAIAAVGSVIGAAPAEMAVAIGTIFVLNAIALYLFPVLGHLIGLDPSQFGLWAGVAIHDVSSVVGAATAYDPAALPIATAVKLSRALWIAPLTLIAARVLPSARPDAPSPPLPWFIGAFLVASACRSLVPALAVVAPAIGLVAKAGLALVLFLIGTSLSLSSLRAVGWRPLAQGVTLWLFVSAAALWAALSS